MKISALEKILLAITAVTALLLGAVNYVTAPVIAAATEEKRVAAMQQVLTAEEGAEIRAIQAALLRHGALGAAMSGSGPTVFGLFDDSDKADRAAEALRGKYRQTYLAAPVKKFGELE